MFAHGRAEWIRRAVDNLLTNAARYAPPGSAITVTIHQDPDATDIVVADDGPGFPAEFLPLAFDRFTRADESRARGTGTNVKWEGSGLGLAIVQSIMARHGGTAVASNRPEGGAQVVLRWPR